MSLKTLSRDESAVFEQLYESAVAPEEVGESRAANTKQSDADKFLVTETAYNRKLGPMMVTTSPRKTCPQACPLRKNAETHSAGACYAEHGFIGGYLWTSLDRLPTGAAFEFSWPCCLPYKASSGQP